MRTSRLMLLWLALPALAIPACGQQSGEEALPADTTMMEPAETPAAPVEITYTLVVTNPMPHAMNVVATMPDGSRIQLGTVAASGEGSYTVTGSAGESVTVTATDDANTHSPSGSITLPEGNTTVSWTIGG